MKTFRKVMLILFVMASLAWIAYGILRDLKDRLDKE